MSKFLNMGFSLEEVLTMATANPAKIINRIPKHGTLQVGAPAHATLLDLVNGPVEFVDTRNNKRQGKVLIKPTNIVITGVAFGQPYQAPFSTR
jgi:dihydroorotase